MGTEDTPGTRGLDIKIDETNWGFKGKNYLFLIGIDKYQHWPTLKCAVKDVQDFADVVTSRYQFEKSDIVFLKDNEATEKKILAGFKQLANKVTEHDNVVIYFSGHGHYMTQTGYWIPVDANIGDENEDEFINTAVVVDRLRTINSLHTFLIIDACFSGALITQIKGTAPSSEQYKSRRVLTSGRAEVVRDGPEGGNSPFARGILLELTQNTNRYISASKLIAQVRDYVERESQQTPTDARLINADDRGGDFIFHLKFSEAEIWASVVKQNTIEAYKKFAADFPKSIHCPEAVEAYKWREAFATNTIDAITDYLGEFADGKYVAQAIEVLDECYWAKATSANTLLGYIEYLKQFPKGKYSAEAREAAKKFRRPEDDRPLDETIDERASRGAHPPKPDEEDAWNNAKNINTFVSYHDFRRSFPNSKYTDEAKAKGEYLDRVAVNQIRIMAASTLPCKQKIENCINYFDDFPGAPNNAAVKQIKDKLEINRIRRGTC